MKGKLFLLLLVPVTAWFILSINACRKSDRDDDTETQSSVDNANSQQLFNDVFKQVAYYAYADSIFKLSGVSCDTSWVTSIAFPKTLTIKYDTVTGCTNTSGITHKGKINAVFTKKLSDSLSVITVSFNDYYINSYKLSGTQTITNKGTVAGDPTFSVKVSNAAITTPAGKTITWNSAQTYKLIAGDTTTTFADDIFSVTGTSNGLGTNGTIYSCTINTALRFELACRYLTSGIFTITPGSLASRTVDLGNGACDNTALVKLAGKSYSITLP